MGLKLLTNSFIFTPLYVHLEKTGLASPSFSMAGHVLPACVLREGEVISSQ